MRLDHLLSKEHVARRLLMIWWSLVGGRVQGHCPDGCSGVVARGWNVGWLAALSMSRQYVWCRLVGVGGERVGCGGWSGTLLGPEGTGVWPGLSWAASVVNRLRPVRVLVSRAGGG